MALAERHAHEPGRLRTRVVGTVPAQRSGMKNAAPRPGHKCYSSLPGLTRHSIHFRKAFDEDRWIRGSSPRMTPSALLAQPHDHVDAADLVAFGHVGHLLQHQMRIGNIDQLVIALEIEV